MGNHLGNWSTIQDKESHISQTTEIIHKANASCTGVVMRKWKKKTRTTRRMTMTMRYGLIKLEAIGTLRHNGCLDSANLQDHNNRRKETS
jgi:hypothetical protein